jgi:hypothetical protein
MLDTIASHRLHRDGESAVMDPLVAFWLGRVDAEAAPECEFVVLAPTTAYQGLYLWLGQRPVTGV